MENIIIDADSICGIILEKVLRIVSNSTPNKIYIVGSNLGNCESCSKKFISTFDPQIVEVLHTKYGRQDAKCIISFIFGKLYNLNVPGGSRNNIFFLTQDKNLTNLTQYYCNDNICIYLMPGFVTSQQDTIRELSIDKENDKIIKSVGSDATIPAWYKTVYDKKDIATRFDVLTPYEKNGNKLTIIPFPIDKKIFTIGKAGDINLKYWVDSHSMYDHNIELEYLCFPQNTWVLRSRYGYRRKKHRVEINGKLISAQMGQIALCNGDLVSLGDMTLRFVEDKRTNLIRHEDAYNLVTECENTFKDISKNFSKDQIPPFIEEDVLDSNGNVDFSKAYLKDYSYLFSYNWTNARLYKLRSLYGGSKSSFIAEFKKINSIRNKIMHPSNGTISVYEKTVLVDFFIKIMRMRVA